MGRARWRQAEPAPVAGAEGVRLCKLHKLGFHPCVAAVRAIDSAKAIAMGAVIDGDVWDF